MRKETEMQINQAKEAFKPYIEKDEELRDMCRYCERYCGINHDWTECNNMPCFRFYLAYKYLEWVNTSDGY